MCDFWSSSINITWELILEMQILRLHPKHTELETRSGIIQESSAISVLAYLPGSLRYANV